MRKMFEISMKCKVKAPDSQSARSSDLFNVRCETGWGTSGEAAVNCMGAERHVLCLSVLSDLFCSWSLYIGLVLSLKLNPVSKL